MGTTASRQRLREPFIGLDVAIYRNLQNWIRLQPVVERVKRLIGYDNPTLTVVSSPVVGSHENPRANESDDDEGVQNAITAIGEAIPPQKPEAIQDPDGPNPGDEGESALHQDLEGLQPTEAVTEHHDNEADHPQDQEPSLDSEGSKEEETWEQDKQGVQNVQSLAGRMEPSLQSTNKPEPASDAPREVQEEYVSMYITTSLNVALPTKAKFPKLSYKPSIFTQPTPGTVTGSNHNVKADAPGNPPETDSLPPPAGSELKIFQTWDKRLYANLPRLDAMSIRVVEILPGTAENISVELTQKTFDEITNNYEALSYVWGAPKPERTISVNNIEVPIQPNLFDALKSLRLTDVKRMIWIDALCINQTSMRERSIEVRKMGEIYRQAKTVAVFLGAPSKAASSVDELFQFLKRQEDSKSPRNYANGEPVNVDEEYERSATDKHAVCKGFVELCLRPWWSRVWVMQEFYLATDEPVWYWGSSHVNNVALKRDMPLLMSTSWDLYSARSEDATLSSKFSSEVQGMIKKSISLFRNDVERINQLISRRATTNGFDIPSRLYCELSAQASNPRDFVYGLREIFDPRFRKVFVPDYFMGVELLFACLAVFLIQFEAWSDVLWWYPHRFGGTGRDELPSWLPDFTRRIKPTESELLPRDHMKSRRNEPKLVILNHILHAEGYKLDNLVAHMHIDKGDGYKVLRKIWEFDMVTNSRMGVDNEVSLEEQHDHPLLRDFLKICDNAAEECRLLDKQYRTSPVNPPKGPVLEWTSRRGFDEFIPTSMHKALPCFDILWFYAYKTGDEGVVKLQLLDDDEPGLLKDVFDSKMDHVFRRTLAHGFITACVLDWENINTILDRLVSSSQWSKPEHPHWSDTNPNFSDVRPFLVQIGGDLIRKNCAWGRPLLYSGIVYAVLLACKTHAAFKRVIPRLKSAASELHEIALDYRTRAYVEQLNAESETVAARIRNYDAIVAKYQGRVLFCTSMGFRGLSSPGVEGCGTSVALLDGLSFPVVLKDANDRSGRQEFVGCAIVNGVDMQDGNIGKVKVPDGLHLGEKIVFKLS